MSSSASTARNLHHDIAEMLIRKEQQVNMSRPQTSEPSVSSTATTPNLLPAASTTAESVTSTLILPSPPDSPNLSPVHSGMHSPSVDSVSESSLPSVSSSFFFSSSAAGSPGRSRYSSSYPHSEHGHDRYPPPTSSSQLPSTGSSPLGHHNLIIPSLTLPSALRRPTPFGQTLGTLRLLVLGAQGAGKSFLTGLLLEDNEDVVEVGTWEDWEAGSLADLGLAGGVSDTTDGAFSYGKVLRASTDWIERQDAFGAERYEPTGNVHIVELPGYSQDADVRFPSTSKYGADVILISKVYRTYITSKKHHRRSLQNPSRCSTSGHGSFSHRRKSPCFADLTLIHRNGLPFTIR